MRALVAAMMLLVSMTASADWITEFGMGYKQDGLGGTSVQLLPICEEVLLTGKQLNDPNSPNWGRTSAGCGGDNPVFIGWPIAWQSKGKGKYGAYTVRIGYFHMSSWCDGGANLCRGYGDDNETKLDMLALSTTFNWSKHRHGRKQR